MLGFSTHNFNDNVTHEYVAVPTLSVTKATVG